MPDRLDPDGALALVTGAGGGIGAALAAALARRGARLALVDRNAEGLEATRAALGNRAEVSLHALDLTDAEARDALPDAVEAAHGAAPAILVNNAGVAHDGTFEDLDAATFDRVMAVNFDAPVRLTRAFLPRMRALPRARIVLVSSLFGLIAPPGQSAYAASKFALRGFGEALRHELAASAVGVTLVHPGGVRTAIARDALLPPGADPAAAAARARAFERNLKLAPEKAAEIIVEGALRRAPRVLVGGDARLISLIQRLAPAGHWRVVERLMARQPAGASE